jgi:hypothetical protein
MYPLKPFVFPTRGKEKILNRKKGFFDIVNDKKEKKKRKNRSIKAFLYNVAIDLLLIILQICIETIFFYVYSFSPKKGIN